MTATYQSMQTRVSARIIDLPTAVLTEVPKLVNVAMHKLMEKHNFKVMEAELAAYTQAENHTLLDGVLGNPLSLPTPELFKEWRGEPWYTRYTDGSPGFMSISPSKQALWGSFTEGGADSNDDGYPQVILEGQPDDSNNRSLFVYPLPDGNSDWPDGEYRITMPFYRYLPDLVSAGDTNWLVNQASAEEFIVKWAAGEGHALNWDFDKYTALTAMAQTHYKDITDADKRYRLSSVGEWVPHWRGVRSTKTRI